MNRAAALLGIALALVWQASSSAGLVGPSVLPSPVAVLAALARDAALWWPHLLASLATALAGLALAVGCALGLAAAMDRWAPVRRALYPWLVLSQTVPVIFVYPLMLIWFGFGPGARVAVVALVCVFPLAVSLIDGLSRTEPALDRMLASFGAGPWARFRFLRFPGALPSAFTGLRISATYCVLGAVLAEWLGARAGLGVYMLRAYKSFDTARVFSAVLLVVALSLALVGAVRLLESRYSHAELAR